MADKGECACNKLTPVPEMVATANAGNPLCEHSMVPPSPTTRRTRRDSITLRAMSGPTKEGKIRWFCREKGHGFVTPADGGDDLFVHILDIDGEYAPHAGDTVSYKLCSLPPKFEKYQAIHVTIRDLVPGVRHERWSEAPSPHPHPHEPPNIPERRSSLSKHDVAELQHK